MRAPRVRRLVGLFCSAFVLTFAACDDAILGVRPLPDASSCEGASCSDAGLDGAIVASEGGDACPSVAIPNCSTGTPVEVRESGCIVRYICGASTCASLGGTCQPLAGCGGMRWTPDASDCTSEVSLGCCRLCPAIAAPPASFCDGGPILQSKEGDCVVGFVCS